MDQGSHLLTLYLDCETVIAKLTSQMRKRGLRVVRSFDLQSACTPYPHLTCPQHGDSPCDCQLVVLLIYGLEAEPASLVIHSNNGKTDIDLVDLPLGLPDSRLEKMIRIVLEIGFGSVLLAKRWSDAS